MIKVKMLKTTTGSSDGLKCSLFRTGMEYSISERLAEVFVKYLGIAKYIVGEDNKMEANLPENKMMTYSQENKRAKKRRAEHV